MQVSPFSDESYSMKPQDILSRLSDYVSVKISIDPTAHILKKKMIVCHRKL